MIATLALFIALGGGAYAASKINGGRLRAHSIAGGKLKKNTLTGAQINENKLGKVPKAKQADNSAALGGTAASGFIQGTGSSVSSNGSVSNNDIQGIALTVPGFGQVAMICNSLGSATGVEFINGSGATETVSITNLGPPVASASNSSLADGATTGLTNVASTSGGAVQVLIHAGINNSSGQDADTVLTVNTPGGGTSCKYQAHALLAG